MSIEGITIEWPLWGLRLVDCRPGFEGGFFIDGSLLYQPTWREWEGMENRDVVEEHAGYLLHSELLGREIREYPPVCMLRISAEDSRGNPDPGFDEHQSLTRCLVSALRLYRPGDFVDPAETGTYYSFPGMIFSRKVEVYRSAFYNVRFDEPYLLAAEDSDPLNHLAYSINQIRISPKHLNAALALENYNLSFGIVTSMPEKALHRFIALEAMLGEIRRSNAEMFMLRVSNALESISQDEFPDCQEWLLHAYELRNSIIHGIHTSTPTLDDLWMLEDATRAVLCSYVFHVSSTRSRHPLRSFQRALEAGPISE